MADQPHINGVGEDSDYLFQSLLDFDGFNQQSPQAYNSGQNEQLIYNAGSADHGGARVLTIIASLDHISCHLEAERERGNARPSVIIKLKDLAARKSIAFAILELYSPTTTAVPSISSQRCTPSRSASPDAIAPEQDSMSLCNDAATLPIEAPATTEHSCRLMAEWAATNDCPHGHGHGHFEDMLPCTAPTTESASSLFASESPSELLSLTTIGSASHTSEGSVRHTFSVTAQRGRRTTPTTATPPETGCVPATGRLWPPATTPEPSDLVSENTVLVGDERPDSNCPDDASHNQRKRISQNSVPPQREKRSRSETIHLGSLIPRLEQLQKVQELTAGQDPSLVHKMVRNARAILAEAPVEASTLQLSADFNTDATMCYQVGPTSVTTQDNIMRQFCSTVRKIEWLEALSFRSMVEYRFLFDQLYQYYMSLQSTVNTKNGERRVTLAKHQLYKTLFPNVEKLTESGRMSDEWERFNRFIRRGKQWHTIASELGMNILQRMPSSIRHSWIEQKLQTKAQLHQWIEIVKLLN